MRLQEIQTPAHLKIVKSIDIEGDDEGQATIWPRINDWQAYQAGKLVG